jgi:SulP family sulfate permease
MSEAIARSGWWSSLFQRGGVARGDIAAGITAALVLPAVEGAYGLLAFKPLGPSNAQTGFLLGASAAAVATIAALLAGGRGPMLSGSSAALALLLGTLFSWLITDVRFLGADGQPFLPMILAFSALGLVLAGLLQALMAKFRIGGLVRFVPYPVHAGYMNGSAVLMIGSMAAHFLGLTGGMEGFDWRDIKPLAPLITLVGLWLALRPPAWTRVVPPYLTGIVGATAAHHLLALTPLSAALGPYFVAPVFEWPDPQTMAPLADRLNWGLLGDHIGPLLLFAAGVAMMSSLQTVLSGSSVDELTHKRRDGDRELFAQGVANVAVGVIGALPSAGSTTRTKVSIDAGGRTRMSRLVFGVALLLALDYGLRFMSLVPMAAIAGVFIAVALSMVDDWTRNATAVLWRQSQRWRTPTALLQNYAVMLLVAGVTVFVSLALAVAIGTLIAMILFIRSNCKAPIRQVSTAGERASRKVRPATDTGLLRAHGRRIALVELDGALFFGTAEAADEEIERLAHGAEYIIIDFERVSEIDASGARVLLHVAERLHTAGKTLLLAGLAPAEARARTVRGMDVQELLKDDQFFPDADRALEAAEDALLASLRPSAGDEVPLDLRETLFGAGLEPAELDLLRARVTERRVAKGEAVFRKGDSGDAMYALLAGQIGIWLPSEGKDGKAARDRRMVSYAPGVVFGELGLMEGRPRSADAIAERNAVLLELSRENYERLTAEQPALTGKLLLNIGLLLASRIRALTDELRAEHSAR